MASSIEVDLSHDLNWLYHCKPLMSALDGFSNHDPALLAISRVSDHRCQRKLLANYPLPPAYRLGKQFEDIVAAAFNRARDAVLLTRNLAIRKQGITLGELDFIYQHRGDVVHLEIAIKFYLFRPPFNSLIDFVGPGGRDLLDIKWRRLTEHQLPLSLTPEVADTLAVNKISQPGRRELLLTGMLFYPYHGWQEPIPRHLGLHPDHRRGWWLFHHQLNQLRANDDQHLRYLIVPRWHWLGGLRHYPNLSPVNFTALANQVQGDLSPAMVIIISRSNEVQQWQELSRGFIVHDNWL